MREFLGIVCLAMLLVNIAATPVFGEEVVCAAGEVKICFLNGDCICKVRSIDMTDTIPPAESECYDDPDDPENTICPWDDQELPPDE